MKKLYKFIELKKYAKMDASELPSYKFAVVADSSTQHLVTALKGQAVIRGISLDVFEADYNQVDSQVLYNNSELYNFSPQYILIDLCAEKLFDKYSKLSVEDKKKLADNEIKKIEKYWNAVEQYSNAKILQFNYIYSNAGVFGNYELKEESSFSYQLYKLNYRLNELAVKNKNVYLVDLNNIQSEIGKKAFYDDKLYYIAKMPISMDALPHVASNVIDVVNAINGKFKKCVVLDLDNTLWGGVIGDEGIDHIQIGDLGIGQAFSRFQQYLKELKNRGVILAVCSKNNEDIAKEPFLKHPDMILKLEDISVFIANWEDKVTNIRKIQRVLNIGMDSIVFIDDNPFERNLVKNAIKEIEVPELPEDPALYLSYIKSLNLFETASYSEEDSKRTDQYIIEAKRNQDCSNYDNYEEYLSSLNMIAKVSPFDDFSIPRISQLTQRSNQFNLRTIRYTEKEILEISEKDNYISRYFTLQDKYGDYGLIAVLIMKKQENALFVDTLLMSCRVLKRGMEELIFNTINEIAKKENCTKVIGEYIETPKNAMVKTLYEQFGYKSIGANQFELNINEYIYRKTNIKVEE